MGLFNWFIPKRFRNKYRLNYITQEMYKVAAQSNIKMYETLMEKDEKVITDKTGSKFRKEFDRVTKESFRAARAQENENFRNMYKLDTLHAFQMERRILCFERFKEILLTIEFGEERAFLQKDCKAIDVICLDKMLKFKYPESVEFAFNDIFYNELFKAMELREKEVVETVIKEQETKDRVGNIESEEKVEKVETAAQENAEKEVKGADEEKAQPKEPEREEKQEDEGEKEGTVEQEQALPAMDKLKKLVAS